MAEIGVEGFGSGDGEKDEAEDGETDQPVLEDERHPVDRIERYEHIRIGDDVDEPADEQDDEPNDA